VSQPKLVSDGEVRAPFAPAGSLVSSGPGGFDIYEVDFPAEGLRGVSTLGDLLLTGVFFACEVEWISWGTLHRNPRVTR
jgi:hypothetical protein